MALSAPTGVHETYALSVVIAVVSVLSAVGAGWIILSFLLFEGQRTFRHQLILGLALSDLWMALNFLTSASINVHGTSIGDASMKGFCTFNGFMIQTFVVQTDYWVLTIALCTYSILANHKHFSNWIQSHKLVIWALPWASSILWASIGLGVWGYGDIGAWCWFTSDRVRLLVNFIPRWLIIFTILFLYIRLYYIIHAAHTRFETFDSDIVASTSNPHLSLHISEGTEPDCEAAAPPPSTFQVSRDTKALRRISLQMMVYPLVYMLIWTMPTTVRIYQATSGRSAPFVVGTIDKACIVVQGLADAIIYGLNERTWRLWRDLLFRPRSKD